MSDKLISNLVRKPWWFSGERRLPPRELAMSQPTDLKPGPCNSGHNQMSSLIPLLVFFCFLSIRSAGTTYYAAPNGSSRNSGQSTSSPWPLAYAVANAGVGNTVIAMDGTYTTPITISMANLTLRAQNKWTAILRPTSSGHGIVVTGSGVTIDGMQVDKSWSDNIKVQAANVTIRNCWIQRAGRGNPNAVPNSDASYSGQGIYTSQNNTIVEYNLIELNGIWNGHDHGIYMSGTNSIIRGNVFRHNWAYGIQIYTGYTSQRCTGIHMYNNLIYANGVYNGGQNAVTIWSSATGISESLTNYFYGNTVIGGTNMYVILAGNGTLCVSNNLILGPPNDGYVIQMAAAPATIICAYNLLHGPLHSGNGVVNAGNNIIASDVHFVNPNNGLFWLAADSPARGKALAGAAGPVNFFGDAQSSVTDIGAFQYNAAYASDTRVLDPSPANPDYWAVLTGTNGGSAAITITPASQGFDSIPVDTTADRTFTVQNSGSGTLSGSASVAAPFSILSGSSYNLGAGLSQVVTVRYSPTTAGSNAATVTFTGANGATAGVSGSALSRPPPPENLQIVSGQ